MLALSKEQVSDFKELFLLLDKDEDGLLTFCQLKSAFRFLGLFGSSVEGNAI